MFSMDKLHVYTTVWNEAYMIKYFLRYYETVADRIFILDDGSDDGTQDIVKACSKATLLPYPFKSGFNEYDKTKCLGTEYKKHSQDAEWVIVGDIDEFIYHPHLRDLLDLKRSQGYRALKATGYFFASKETPNTEGQLFDAMPYIVRLKNTPTSYDREVLFDPKLDVEFRAGCHPPTKFSDGVRAMRCGLSLYHCCYLSKQWIIDHLDRRIARMNDPSYKNVYLRKREVMLNKAFARYNSMINA